MNKVAGALRSIRKRIRCWVTNHGMTIDFWSETMTLYDDGRKPKPVRCGHCNADLTTWYQNGCKSTILP